MADQDPVLALLDDLVELVRTSVATSIEVSADSFAVSVTRDSSSALATSAMPIANATEPTPAHVQRVHAPAVGIFGATRVWNVGERVARGDALGAIQTLGHMAEIVAPADGTMTEVLVSTGVPVEYGQPLFAITLN